MKKILLSFAVACVSLAASAQGYVGGSIGIASSKIGNSDNVTTYQVLPEVGVNLDENWAIGTVVGWGKGSPVNIESENSVNNYFKLEPYVRYTYARSKYVNGFIDGGFAYQHYRGGTNAWSVGLKPGVAVNVSPKVSFVAHVGFAGWKSVKQRGASNDAHTWGASLDGNNITFGVYYNF